MMVTGLVGKSCARAVEAAPMTRATIAAAKRNIDISPSVHSRESGNPVLPNGSVSPFCTGSPPSCTGSPPSRGRTVRGPRILLRSGEAGVADHRLPALGLGRHVVAELLQRA